MLEFAIIAVSTGIVSNVTVSTALNAMTQIISSTVMVIVCLVNYTVQGALISVNVINVWNGLITLQFQITMVIVMCVKPIANNAHLLRFVYYVLMDIF